MNAVADVAKILSGSRSLLALTGAGVSAESGVPTFRGPGGLWRDYRAEDLATPQAFARDPRLVWEWYDWRRSIVSRCSPNPAHRVLSSWESRFSDYLLATQNVDGLHTAAGSRRVVELHGNLWRMRCTRERRVWEERAVPIPELPPRCPACGAMARPEIVWFGESLPEAAMEQVFELLGRCDVFLSCGTSSVVQPAASFGLAARSRGAAVIEVNPEATPLTPFATVSLRRAAGEVLPEIESLLGS